MHVSRLENEIWKIDNVNACLGEVAETNEDKEKDKYKILGFYILCEAIAGSSLMKKTEFFEHIEDSLEKKNALDSSFTSFFQWKNSVIEEKDFLTDIKISGDMNFKTYIDKMDYENTDYDNEHDYILEVKKSAMEANNEMHELEKSLDKNKFFTYSWKTNYLLKSFFLPYMLSISSDIRRMDDDNESEKKLYFWPISGPNYNHRTIDVSAVLYERKASKDGNQKLMNHIMKSKADHCLNSQQSCVALFTTQYHDAKNASTTPLFQNKYSKCDVLIDCKDKSEVLGHSFKYTIARKTKEKDIETFFKNLLVSKNHYFYENS